MAPTHQVRTSFLSKIILSATDLLLSRKAARQKTVNLIMGFALTLVSAWMVFFEWAPLEPLENKLYDFHLLLRGVRKPPDQILIAAIDDKSLEHIGRWPWGRDVLARLIRRLGQGESEIIVLDIILSESEKNDAVLAQALREQGNVLLPLVFEFDRDTTVPSGNELVRYAFQTVVNPEAFTLFHPITGRKVTTPVPVLLKEVMTLGHINMFPDRDGTLRWEALAIGYQGRLYPSLDLQALAVYLGIPAKNRILKATEAVYLGAKRIIPTDVYGRSLINYYGPERTFPQVSVCDILEGKIQPEMFAGKIVLVGATATGIYDLRVTPFSPAMPGIEKHANVMASILEGRFLRKTSTTVNLVILVAVSLAFTLLVIRFKAAGASALASGTIILILAGGHILFVREGLWIYSAVPSLNILLIFIGVTAFNYAAEERYARRIRFLFSSYVTERVVNELIKNPELTRLGGERREVTVLFSDVRGFTSFSEKHAPEEVVGILNEYLGVMTEVVFHWEGTLDKFIGDAILAFWGAPLRQENHAELAVRCALHMIQRLKELQKKWADEGKPVLDAGIGLNTGEVLVGTIGAAGKKMDYTVIGDHVNLGARVESLTRKYNAHILITEHTLEKIRPDIKRGALGHLSSRGIQKVAVKGKRFPVGIYDLSSLEPETACEVIECTEDRVVVLDQK